MSVDVFGRSGLSIDRLRALVAVADAGGISRAAPRQPVRQSQLSRQIAELEELFGQDLVRRAGRSIELTDLGRELASVARALGAGLEDVARAAESRPVPFTLGAGDSLLQWWVLPRIAAALARAPRVTLSLVALSQEDLVDRVLGARLDFALIRGRPPAGLEAHPVGRLAYALFVPEALAARALESLPWAIQSSEPQLAAPLRAAIERAGGEGRILTCETFPQVARAVATGHFAGMLPSLARPELGAVRALSKSKWLPGAVEVHLVHRPRTSRARPAAESLAEALRRELVRGGASPRQEARSRAAAPPPPAARRASR